MESASYNCPDDSEETLYFGGDEFFDSLFQSIERARQTIEIETYIFANDSLGQRMATSLESARARGVKVRVIIDGIGSWWYVNAVIPMLSSRRIPFKIYHGLPWQRIPKRHWAWRPTSKVLSLFSRLNQRNHRKIFLIDRREAYVGSMNVVDVHLKSVHATKAWRDTGIRITGCDVTPLLLEFERLWQRRFSRRRRSAKRSLKQAANRTIVTPTIIRLNSSRKLRRANYEQLLDHIRNAKKKIWITNAYFVPTRSLLKTLEAAADRGVDVRILVPHKSDVFFLPWVTSAFLLGLTRAGVRCYEYLPSMLHAKTLTIDDWGLVGSSNLNHRSLLHDLEADVILCNPKVVEALTGSFLEDLESAEEFRAENWERLSWWRKAAGRLALRFRYYL